MKNFKCGNCDSIVFFENVFCETCGDALGFIPETMEMASFSISNTGDWKQNLKPQNDNISNWKPCINYKDNEVCNWMLSVDDPSDFCWSCRYTEIIPALNKPENKQSWFLLEAAKRRLFYTLYTLKLPIPSRMEQPEKGLVFHFKEDDAKEGEVLTGHDSGLITLNIAEAEDVEREIRRKAMHEPYRTLLGHFRHESGHFYWDQLIDGTNWIEPYRELFGDERMDYENALQLHYQQGPPLNWESNYVSAYASTHPWEDWAESWAHYLHIVDALDTAEHWQLTVAGEIATQTDNNSIGDDFSNILLNKWAPVAQFLNSMSRSLGHKDSYPFLLPSVVVQKLSFIDGVVKAKYK